MGSLSKLYLLLLVITNYLVLVNSETDEIDYCKLCKHHTMCLYPFNNTGTDCINLQNDELNTEEIDAILHHHNLYRNFIASGQEVRGKPGPQPTAENMTELLWDMELAQIAERWALQCIPSKDGCRDVSRFAVWQNIHILYIESLEAETTGLYRIPLHIQSWSDDVGNFDTAEVGLVDFARDDKDDRPYIGMAAGKITHVGCGRALYSVDLRHLKTTPLKQTRENRTFYSLHVPQAHQRLEVLVCNYGPIDFTIPQNLYNVGIPGKCPVGFINSKRYEYLCKPKLKNMTDAKWWIDNKDGKNLSNMIEHSIMILFSSILGQFLINMLLSIG